jgi:hypothetical protein
LPTPLTKVVLVPTKLAHGKHMYASASVNEETTFKQLIATLAINVTNEDKVKEMLIYLSSNIGRKNGSKGKSTSTFIVPKEEKLTPLKAFKNKETPLQNTTYVVEIKEYDNLKRKLITIVDDIHLSISTNHDVVLLEGKIQKFDFVTK